MIDYTDGAMWLNTASGDYFTWDAEDRLWRYRGPAPRLFAPPSFAERHDPPAQETKSEHDESAQ